MFANLTIDIFFLSFFLSFFQKDVFHGFTAWDGGAYNSLADWRSWDAMLEVFDMILDDHAHDDHDDEMGNDMDTEMNGDEEVSVERTEGEEMEDEEKDGEADEVVSAASTVSVISGVAIAAFIASAF